MTPGSAGGELGDHGALRPPGGLVISCFSWLLSFARPASLPSVSAKKKKVRLEEFQERQVPMFFSTSRHTAQTVAAFNPDLVLDADTGELLTSCSGCGGGVCPGGGGVQPVQEVVHLRELTEAAIVFFLFFVFCFFRP